LRITRDWLHLESMLKRLEFQIRNLSGLLLFGVFALYKCFYYYRKNIDLFLFGQDI